MAETLNDLSTQDSNNVLDPLDSLPVEDTPSDVDSLDNPGVNPLSDEAFAKLVQLDAERGQNFGEMAEGREWDSGVGHKIGEIPEKGNLFSLLFPDGDPIAINPGGHRHEAFMANSMLTTFQVVNGEIADIEDMPEPVRNAMEAIAPSITTVEAKIREQYGIPKDQSIQLSIRMRSGKYSQDGITAHKDPRGPGFDIFIISLWDDSEDTSEEDGLSTLHYGGTFDPGAELSPDYEPPITNTSNIGLEGSDASINSQAQQITPVHYGSGDIVQFRGETDVHSPPEHTGEPRNRMMLTVEFDTRQAGTYLGDRLFEASSRKLGAMIVDHS